MGRFTEIFHGNFAPDKVTLHRDGGEIEISDWVREEIIDPEWDALIQQKFRNRERPPSNGRLSRWEHYTVHEFGKALDFQLGEMGYKEYMGMRAIAHTYEKLFPGELPLRVGVTGVIILNAGKPHESCVWNIRSRDVADYPSREGIGAAGGLAVDAATAFDGTKRELSSEYAVEDNDIVDMALTGFVRDGRVGNNTELTLATRVNKSPEEIGDKILAISPDEIWERKEVYEAGQQKLVLHVSHTADALAQLARHHDDKLMPTATGALLTYGRVNPFNVPNLGEEWHSAVMHTLRRQWLKRTHDYTKSKRSVLKGIAREYGTA